MRPLQSDHSYRCAVMRAGSLVLRLELSAGKPPTLQLATGAITLVELHRGATSSEGSQDLNVHGFVFYERNAAVAAVDLSLGLESVRLRQDLAAEQRDALACACMALLIRSDMRL